MEILQHSAEQEAAAESEVTQEGRDGKRQFRLGETWWCHFDRRTHGSVLTFIHPLEEAYP